MMDDEDSGVYQHGDIHFVAVILTIFSITAKCGGKVGLSFDQRWRNRVVTTG